MVWSPSGVRSQVIHVPGTVLSGDTARYPDPLGDRINVGRALRRPTLPSATDKGGIFCRHRVPDGPTLDAPDCIADENLRKICFDAERQRCASFHSADHSWEIRFGSVFQVAFRPSPHPRIRWTVASPDRAPCALGPTRPPPPRVPKCPTKCRSMPPNRKTPGSLMSAAITSPSLISRRPSARNSTEL